jgi:peptidoglycan/LPS O-acetylase OafA/YrhL
MLNLLAVVWTKAHLPANGWTYIAAGMVLCITVAWFTHRWLEVPILAYLRRRFEPRRAILAA